MGLNHRSQGMRIRIFLIVDSRLKLVIASQLNVLGNGLIIAAFIRLVLVQNHKIRCGRASPGVAPDTDRIGKIASTVCRHAGIIVAAFTNPTLADLARGRIACLARNLAVTANIKDAKLDFGFAPGDVFKVVIGDDPRAPLSWIKVLRPYLFSGSQLNALS